MWTPPPGAGVTGALEPFLLKIRQAKPDLVATNLGGNQVTNFVKQYSEYGLPYPVAAALVFGDVGIDGGAGGSVSAVMGRSEAAR